MGKNRVKRFISIINNLSCVVIFGAATMSLVSPGFFASQRGNPIAEEGMEIESDASSDEVAVFELMPHIDNEFVDSNQEQGVLNRVQPSNWRLVSIAQ